MEEKENVNVETDTNVNTENTNEIVVQEKTYEQENGAVSKFFHNVMSVDETRISVLMFCLLLSVIFGAIVYKDTGVIDHNWVDVIETFAICVTGINIASTLSSKDGIFSQFVKK